MLPKACGDSKMTDAAEQNNPVSNGKELLDATQNAVIEAVGNVSEILEKSETKTQAVVEEQSDEAPFYAEAEFWVGVAFILLVVGLFAPISKVIKSLLKAKIDGIVNRIDSAIKLRDDAQTLLADYERKLRNADSDASAIVEQAKNRIELQKQQQINQLDNELRIKTQEMENLIKSSVDAAKKEILQKVCEKSIHIAAETLKTKIGDVEHDLLIDKSIEKLKNLK